MGRFHPLRPSLCWVECKQHLILPADHMNLYQSNIAHTVVDLMSKNFWGMMGHILRLKVRHAQAKAQACRLPMLHPYLV